MAKLPPRRKIPWHPRVQSCAMLALPALLLVLSASYVYLPPIGEKLAAEVLQRMPMDGPCIQRVRGGIVRTGVTRGEWAWITALDFRTRDRLTFTGRRALTRAEMAFREVEFLRYIFAKDEQKNRYWRDVAIGQLSSSLHQCDLASGEQTALLAPPEGLMIFASRGWWSEDGAEAILPLVARSDVVGPPPVHPEPTLYAASVGDGSAWRKLTPGLGGVNVSKSGWVVFWRRSGRKHSAWAIRRDGTGERCLGDEAVNNMLGTDDGATHVAVLLNAEGASPPWALRVVELDSGEESDVAPVDVGVRHGRLADDEFPVAWYHPGKADGDRGSSDIGAVNTECGRLRWLRKGLLGKWDVKRAVWEGKGVLLRLYVDDYPENERLSWSPDGSYYETGRRWVVLSAADGRLRLVHALGARITSDATETRWAWSVRKRPLPTIRLCDDRADIAVFDILYPEELLSGKWDY